ncbi:hypothetical protein HZZ02_06040 [Streptococcus danieliae]|nr:hypothetical protein [Streptococcus danieliae]
MKKDVFVTALLSAVLAAGAGVYFGRPYVEEMLAKQAADPVTEARIMANGDLLYHDLL